MGSAHSAVAFDYTVTTTFGNGLALWGFVVAIFNQTFFFKAVTTVFSDSTLWGFIVTVFSYSLTLWGFVVAIFSNQAFFFQAIITTFGEGLALWSAIRTIGCNGLTECGMTVFDLRCGLISGWQSKSGAG